MKTDSKPPILSSASKNSPSETARRDELVAYQNHLPDSVNATPASETKTLPVATTASEPSSTSLSGPTHPTSTRPIQDSESAWSLPATLDNIPPCGLPRLDANGTLRLTSARQLLGYWLSGLHEGFLTLLCEPSEHPQSTIDITIKVEHHQHTETTSVVGRSGPWVTVQWPNLAPIRSLVSNTADSWTGHIQALSTQKPATPTSTSTTTTSPFPPEPILTSSPSRKYPQQDTVDLSKASAVSAQNQVNKGPPILSDNQVHFAHDEALRNELTTNLSNGGLFVQSGPIPLREQRSLTLIVGNKPLSITLKAEVVFAANNMVGFSITNAPEICQAVEQWLVGSCAAQPETTSLSSTGTIIGPPSINTLVSLPNPLRGPKTKKTHLSTVELFNNLTNDHFCGSLRLQTPDIKGCIYFHEGNVTFVELSPFEVHTSLGQLLIQQRKLSESSLKVSLSQSQQTNTPLGEILIARGLVPQDSIVAALREQTRSRSNRLLSLCSGEFRIDSNQSPPRQHTLVVTKSFGILAQHLRQQLQQLQLTQLEQYIKPCYTKRLVTTAYLDEGIMWFGWTAKERRFFQSIAKSPSTLVEALRRSPLPSVLSLRLIVLGLALGLLRAQQESPKTSSKTDWQKLRQDLGAKWDLMHTQNHFENLGVHWSTHNKRLKEAYKIAIEEFSPKQPRYQEAPSDVHRLLNLIVKTIQESYSLLSNAGERIKYRQQLFRATDLEYAANMLKEKGEVELLRGDSKAAIENFEIALELSPDNRTRKLLNSALVRP